MLMMARIYSRLANTGLIVEASLKVHTTVGVLPLPVRGTHEVEEVHTFGKVASCRTKVANFRAELVLGLIKLIMFDQMSGGDWRRQTKCVPSPLGSNLTHPPPKPDAMMYPKSVGCYWTISAKLVGRCFICAHRSC